VLELGERVDMAERRLNAEVAVDRVPLLPLNSKMASEYAPPVPSWMVVLSPWTAPTWGRRWGGGAGSLFRFVRVNSPNFDVPHKQIPGGI
jgi:hypothetical protein